MTDQKINNVLSGVVDMLKEMGYDEGRLCRGDSR